MRSEEKEFLDLGPEYYSKEEYENCLLRLDQIGRWLGGDAATFNTLKKMEPPPSSILDVGCGGGLFAIKLAKRYPKARVVGIDLNPLAIEFASKQPSSSNLSFECRAEAKLQEPAKSYDVVMATLVCHHIGDDDLVDFIKRACLVAKRKVILNDLHRHSIALLLFKTISPIFFRNRLVQHDGPLSIKRAFIYKDLVELLKKAGATSYQIRWHFAFRWIIEIDCQESYD